MREKIRIYNKTLLCLIFVFVSLISVVYGMRFCELITESGQKSTINKIKPKDKDLMFLSYHITPLTGYEKNFKKRHDIKKRIKEILSSYNIVMPKDDPKLVACSAYNDYINFIVTAYDLSIQSCGKSINHPAYGLTASGVSLKGQDLYSARAIAVDTNVIPLGSQVEIIFNNDNLACYNGIYNAVDTGSAIVGNKIDLFFGDYNQNHAAQEVLNFGVQNAKVRIIQ